MLGADEKTLVLACHHSSNSFDFARALKKIAIYGSYVAKVPVRQRYWIKRADGVFQRYWKQTKRMRAADMSGRYEFWGKGKNLYQAVVNAHRYVPKRFVNVSAEKFVEHPEHYGYQGKWIERQIES
jgi:hypothetical protein